MSWRLFNKKLIAICLIAFAPLVSGQVSPGFVATSSQNHIWFAVETGRAGGPVSLLHIPVSSTDPIYNTILELPLLPEAMAAWKDRLWLVFPPEVGAEDRREVFTVRIGYNATLERFFPSPADHLIQEPPLPNEGILVSAVGTKQGPVVMIESSSQQPEPGARRTGAPEGHSVATSLEDVELYGLRRGKWDQLPALVTSKSEDVSDLTGPLFLATQGSDRDEVTVLVNVTDGTHSNHVAAALTLTTEGEESKWTSRLINLNLSQVQGLLTVGGRLMLQEQAQPAAEIGVPATGDVIALAYVYANRRLPLLEFDQPAAESWVLLGTSSGVELLEVFGPGRFMIRHIRTNAMATIAQSSSLSDDDKAVIGIPLELQPASKFGPELWQVTVLSVLMMGLVLLLLLVRPPARGAEMTLPQGVQLMPLSTRLLALLIDFIPGGLVAIFIIQAEFSDLLRIPSFNLALTEGLPYLVMVTITVLHEGITEQICRCTLGKAILGCQIISLDGMVPDRRRLLIRSVVKWIVLLLPVLVIVNILSRLLQGVHDQAAGTLVVRRTKAIVPPPEA